MTAFGRGWKPDDPAGDHLDKKFALPIFSRASKYMPESWLPQDIDLFSAFPPVLYQGQTQTCTTHALSTCMRFNFIDDTGIDIPLSPLQPYFGAGLLENDISDDGRQIRDVITVARTLGVCVESMWPLDLTKIQEQPPPDAYANAAFHKVTDAFAVEINMRAIRTALYVGNPVIIGLKIFKEFEQEEVATTGFVPMPGRFETEIGAHALVIGRNNQGWKRQNKLRNSWGADFGDRGDVFMSDEYILKFGSDAWSITASVHGDEE